MKTHRWTTSGALLPALVTFGIAAVACGTSSHHESATGQTSRSTTATEHNVATETTPITLAGCLQAGNRGTYVLTELNAPKQPDSSNPVVVADEKLAAAEKAYVLSSDKPTDLSKLVGNRVHVEGTLARSSDLVGNK